MWCITKDKTPVLGIDRTGKKAMTGMKAGSKNQ